MNNIIEILSVVSNIIKDIQHFDFFKDESDLIFKMDQGGLQIGDKKIQPEAINHSKRLIETTINNIIETKKINLDDCIFRVVCDLDNNGFGRYIKYIMTSEEGTEQLKSLFNVNKNGNLLSLSMTYHQYDEFKEIINIILGQ